MKKKKFKRAKQGIISDKFRATMIEHVFIHQKTMTEKYEICFEIKNVLLPENCVLNSVFSIFWCIVYWLLDSVYILIALFMGYFARGVRGLVNSVWSRGFEFNVFRKWIKVSEIVF